MEPAETAETADIPRDMQRSSRDREELRKGLQRSAAGHLPGSEHEVTDLEATSANGMSSETLLFEVRWRDGGQDHHERLAARIAPSPADVPVFPTYDMVGQYRTIETVAELTDVPVPPPRWVEPSGDLIGTPFFVMGRVDGEVPPDVMPYNFGESWLFHASPEQQRRLQDSSIAVLARLHAIDRPRERFPHLLAGDLKQHLEAKWDWYRFAAADCGPSPLIEKAFAWLDDHRPTTESELAFCWGDARIGNVMYRDFEPVAVLDWEMAVVAPPETDLAWMIYLHRMFEDLAANYGFPGMAEFMRAEDAAGTYESLTGKTPRDLDWYVAYAALQFAVVGLRTGWRSVHFGEREAPGSADELVMNAPTLTQLTGG